MSYKKIFKVGGHLFSISTTDSVKGVFGLLKNYKPFEVVEAEGEEDRNISEENMVFGLNIDSRDSLDIPDKANLVLKFEGEAVGIELYEMNGTRSFFVFHSADMSSRTAVLVNDNGEKGNSLFVDLKAKPSEIATTVNNSLMLLYAFYTSRLDTLLIHAAAVSCKGSSGDEKGYVFLGKSGTGKSTHSRLWLQNVEGCLLMNDDNPVLRYTPEGVMVYGSPWSGKTPCYRNVVFPLGGIVRLAQDPENSIRRLAGVEAYAALVPSASSMKWKRNLADGQHCTLSSIIERVPVYMLRCRPDSEAALLCHDCIVE